MQNKTVYRIFSHLLPWLALFFLPLIFFGMEPNSWQRYRVMFYLNFTMIIIVFYLNKHIFIPRFLYKQKFWWFGICGFLCLLIPFFITKMIYHWVIPSFFEGCFTGLEEAKAYVINKNIESMSPELQTEMFREYFKNHIKGEPITNPQKTIIATLVAFTISTSLSITKKWYQNELQKKEMAKEQFETELMFLKSQVNPHFLFNTLNGIYSLANKKSDKTPGAIVKLSSLIRYMLYDSNKEFVNLDDELDYIGNYIDLQKMRLHDDIDFKYTIEGSTKNRLIAPMLLVPFVENAFKHGVDYCEKSKVYIKIRLSQDELKINVVNTKHHKTDKEGDSGIGLKNVKRRLELMYPEKHLLHINDFENEFQVNMTLILKTYELPNS